MRARGTKQAELILRLYELRRETAMREARSYVGGGTFAPRSTGELVALVSTGGTDLPEWMQNIEKVIEKSAKGRKRIAMMRKSMGRIAEERKADA